MPRYLCKCLDQLDAVQAVSHRMIIITGYLRCVYACSVFFASKWTSKMQKKIPRCASSQTAEHVLPSEHRRAQDFSVELVHRGNQDLKWCRAKGLKHNPPVGSRGNSPVGSLGTKFPETEAICEGFTIHFCVLLYKFRI